MYTHIYIIKTEGNGFQRFGNCETELRNKIIEQVSEFDHFRNELGFNSDQGTENSSTNSDVYLEN